MAKITFRVKSDAPFASYSDVIQATLVETINEGSEQIRANEVAICLDGQILDGAPYVNGCALTVVEPETVGLLPTHTDGGGAFAELRDLTGATSSTREYRLVEVNNKATVSTGSGMYSVSTPSSCSTTLGTQVSFSQQASACVLSVVGGVSASMLPSLTMGDGSLSTGAFPVQIFMPGPDHHSPT